MSVMGSDGHKGSQKWSLRNKKILMATLNHLWFRTSLLMKNVDMAFWYVIIIIYQSMIIFLYGGNGLPNPRHDMQGKNIYIKATS